MIKTIITSCLVLVAAQSVAQPTAPSPAASAASGDFLRRSELVLKRAATEADQTIAPSDLRNVELAERIARGVGAVKNQPVASTARAAALPMIGEHAAQTLPNQLQSKAPSAGVFIFVSDSMSDDELKASFEVANAEGATVFYRGIRKGFTLNKAYARPVALARTLDKLPDLQIDPRPFEHFGVTTVPTVVFSDGSEFVKVSGTLSVDYARRKFHAKEYGDAGSRGTVVDIVEPDFLEEMKDRILKIDFEQKKKDGHFSVLGQQEVCATSYHEGIEGSLLRSHSCK